MEIVLWLAAGAALGWAAIAYLRFNEPRGTIVSIISGAAGALAGGKLIAPMLVVATPGEFSLGALLVVMACAAACLALGNLVHERYGV
jgi:uncharacterized membrane protein YeaQ/YmgE (transglycosylase-associated protein family)